LALSTVLSGAAARLPALPGAQTMLRVSLRTLVSIHASITLAVDTYGRWLPMGNKAAVDRLDEATGSKLW
jgi:hypothetical protein